MRRPPAQFNTHGNCKANRGQNSDAFLNRLIEDEQPARQAEIELVVKMAVQALQHIYHFDQDHVIQWAGVMP